MSNLLGPTVSGVYALYHLTPLKNKLGNKWLNKLSSI